MAELLIGTASWSHPSWQGVFYPPGTPASDYLAHYAREFRTVEVDSTYYAPPTPRMVDAWRARTPEGFLLSAKVPGMITHERRLVDCDAELDAFLTTMRRLGPRLGCLLLQFPYFKKQEFPTLDAFLDRLVPFLQRLPTDLRFAVEVRNRQWLQPPLFEVLRARSVALALIDHPYMPSAGEYLRFPGIVTADFLYVRWLGDRYRIEEITQSWDRLVVDRQAETARWIEALRALMPRVQRVLAYYNNHYAGCAFASVRQFLQAWALASEARPGVAPHR